MAHFQINLHEAVYSLSDALDLVGVTHIHHGKRVAYIAAECGKNLNWPKPRMDTLFQAAILHDCGVSKTQVHSRLAQLAWEDEAEHSQRGAELVKGSPVHVFSCIVDAKSTFTREHSDGVASLARHIGGLFGMSERTCDMLELAGLLHDLGKLRVPDTLLEKPGKLNSLEYAAVQRHSFDTYNILKNIHGFEDIALWAGQHHERVNGSGYPYHLKSPQLSREARIIAVADVFQALAQNRPYRKALSPQMIGAMLLEEVARGKLDADVVQRVVDNLQTCWKASLAYSTLPAHL